MIAPETPSVAFMARILTLLPVDDLAQARTLSERERILARRRRQWRASQRAADRESRRLGFDVEPERSPHGVDAYDFTRPTTLTEFAAGVGVSRIKAQHWRSGRVRWPADMLGRVLAKVPFDDWERAYWPLTLLGQYEGPGVLGDAVRAAAEAVRPADRVEPAGTVGALVD